MNYLKSKLISWFIPKSWVSYEFSKYLDNLNSKQLKSLFGWLIIKLYQYELKDKGNYNADFNIKVTTDEVNIDADVQFNVTPINN